MSRIIVRTAESADAEGIAHVCAEGWRDTYRDIYTEEQVEAVIAEYYTPERIRGEISAPEGWDGWLVAIDDGRVVGAGGGGMIELHAGEIFVLYLDPVRRRQGIGTLLLDAITQQQLAHGAREQWVSVEPENTKGLPLYEADGSALRLPGNRPRSREWTDRSSAALTAPPRPASRVSPTAPDWGSEVASNDCPFPRADGPCRRSWPGKSE